MEVIESVVTDAIEVEESTTTVTTLETEKSKTGKMWVSPCSSVCTRHRQRGGHDEPDATDWPSHQF